MHEASRAGHSMRSIRKAACETNRDAHQGEVFMKKITVVLSVVSALVLSLCLLAGCGAKQEPVTVENGIIQETGTYKVPATLEGGSGKATIESPATVTVDANGMTATITWSSSSYDLMVVDDAEYRPTSTSGKSTFEIPVASLDAPLPVQAETTAMAMPHLIDYTITFDASGAKAA